MSTKLELNPKVDAEEEATPSFLYDAGAKLAEVWNRPVWAVVHDYFGRLVIVQGSDLLSLSYWRLGCVDDGRSDVGVMLVGPHWRSDSEHLPRGVATVLRRLGQGPADLYRLAGYCGKGNSGRR